MKVYEAVKIQNVHKEALLCKKKPADNFDSNTVISIKSQMIFSETDFHLLTKQVSLWPSIVAGAVFLLLGIPLLTMIFGETAGSTSG